MDEGGAANRELLGVEDVARYLGVRPTTVYRWCREGRLPCLKIGKGWRIRRSALEDFLQRGERRQRLVDHLRPFFTVPDHVIGVAEDLELLDRLDAAFFQVGEARDGLLIKYHAADPRPPADLRRTLTRHGLEVARLEREGRFAFRDDPDPVRGRVESLRRLLTEEASGGRTVWVTYEWVESIDLEAALGQQEALAAAIDAHPCVVKTSVLQPVADQWPPPLQRRVQRHYRGQIWLARAGLFLTRSAPLPAA